MSIVRPAEASEELFAGIDSRRLPRQQLLDRIVRTAQEVDRVLPGFALLVRKLFNDRPEVNPWQDNPNMLGEITILNQNASTPEARFRQLALLRKNGGIANSRTSFDFIELQLPGFTGRAHEISIEIGEGVSGVNHMVTLANRVVQHSYIGGNMPAPHTEIVRDQSEEKRANPYHPGEVEAATREVLGEMLEDVKRAVHLLCNAEL